MIDKDDYYREKQKLMFSIIIGSILYIGIGKTVPKKTIYEMIDDNEVEEKFDQMYMQKRFPRLVL